MMIFKKKKTSLQKKSILTPLKNLQKFLRSFLLKQMSIQLSFKCFQEINLELM